MFKKKNIHSINHNLKESQTRTVILQNDGGANLTRDQTI